MSETYIHIVRDFIAASNRHQVDRMRELIAEDCVLRQAPCVYLGVALDCSSGKAIVTEVVPNGPAAGIVAPGDELICASDVHQRWDGSQALKDGLWSQGPPGSKVRIALRRGERVIECELQRARLDSPAVRFCDLWNTIGDSAKDWPGRTEEIELIFEAKDLVAVVSTISGAHAPIGRTAVWGRCSVFRLKEGRIVEIRGVEDSLAQMRQLAFQVIAPGAQGLSDPD